MAVNDPTGIDNSLIGRIAKLEERLSDLSGAPIGKVKFAAQTNSASGFSWTGTGGTRSWIQVTAPITVPPLATSVAIFALATSVVCSNAAANVSAFSFLSLAVPELGWSLTDGPNVFVPTNQQAQRTRAGSLYNYQVTPGQTLTVTANGDAYNTGANINNFLGIDAFAIFQY